MDEKRQIPIKNGLWREPVVGEPQLLGDLCTDCGELFFPKRGNGICVHCQHTNLKTVFLSRTGKLSTFTVVMVPPAGGFYMGTVPYAYGCVDLPEGVRIKARLKADNLDTLQIGMDVEMFLEKIRQNQDGTEIITFAFRPIDVGR